MSRKGKRLATIFGMLAVLATAAGLVLTALSDSVAFFHSPTDIHNQRPDSSQRIRLGGIVETGTVERREGGSVSFRVTDTVESVSVAYTGLLPDLFREGQGIVAEGRLGQDGTFVADTVLAKHDETYMPKEVVDDLKARGIWKDGSIVPTAERAVPGAGS